VDNAMARILFVQNYNDELLGIKNIASYIKMKHQASVVFGSCKDIIKKYYLFKPNVVGISVLTKDHNWALNIAGQIKSVDKDSMILLGGSHPTFYPDIINDNNIDAICIGEGEKPVLNLLNNIDSNESLTSIKSLWLKKDNKVYKNELEVVLGVNKIPIADFSIYNDLVNAYKPRRLMVMCSRGCLFECAFCCEYQLKKMYGAAYFGFRKQEDVIKEIELALKDRNLKSISFQDENFVADKGWLQEFLKQYKRRIALPFYCLTRCEYVTEEVAEQLKEAGCFRVGIGVESGDEYLRNKVLNKRLSETAIKRAVDILRNKKIKFHTFNMFGLPEEDFEKAFKTVTLNIRLKPDVAWSSLFQPYPGTKFFNNRTKDSILDSNFNRFKINYSYTKDSVRIERLQKLFMLTVKLPLMRYFLPILTKLPLDSIYDRISKLCWLYWYKRKLQGA